MMFQKNLFGDDEERKKGEARKQAAHSLLLSSARRKEYLTRARRALLRVLLDHHERDEETVATADDVRAAVTLPAGISPEICGAVPIALARAGIIAEAGYVKTTRPEAHARPVTLWRLIDPEAAREWLRRHPETSGEATP